jgi:DNA topoisomerase-1
LSEKPTAAKRIAYALDQNNTPKEIKKRKISYYECSRGKDTLIVAYALGHLYELRQTEKGWDYPRLDTEWVPKYEVVKKATDIKPLINLIRRLSKEVDRFVVATDYDIEGSLIGYLILKYGCKIDPHNAQRMIFSTLTKTDLIGAYENISPLNFPMIEAGQVRHEIDWLYGINLTRALTLSIKRTVGWFKIVSTGRVQGPTLSFVAEREREVNLFVPLPFWLIQVKGKYDSHEIDLEYSKKRIDTKKNADSIVNDLQGKAGIVDTIKKRTLSQNPPVPFNLSGLQAESYRHFGFRPSRTLVLAQKLYLEALISYPRTSSQKIPKSIDVKTILKGLSNSKTYASLAKRVLDKGKSEPVQGKKTDPAHPAIHPTGDLPSRRLTPSEKKLYDLIIKRFFALFGDPAVKESLRADIRCDNHILYVRGLKILKPGWIEFYQPYAHTVETPLPPLKQDDSILLEPVFTKEKHTLPPPRYNPASLLKVLEKENLGTKSTRAGIVDSLKSRGYTLDDRFELTSLGYAAFETLNQYVPEMLSVEFTRQLENEMMKIQSVTSDRKTVLKHAKENLLKILEQFHSQEDEIGGALVQGLQRYWKAQQELGPCPKCGEGTLIIVQSPKTGKRFVGCSNYREKKCDLTFPLPQKGSITPLEKPCPYCGHYMIKVSSGRRTWETCVNWTECPGRKEELEELEKRRSQAKLKKESQEND